MSAFSPIEKSLWLHKVCEANFARLNQLIPGLELVGDRLTAEVPGKPALHLRLIERSPFTLVLELTHDFTGGYAMPAEPAVRLRVCLDARTVEMLSDTARPGVHDVLRGAGTGSGAGLQVVAQLFSGPLAGALPDWSLSLWRE